MPDVRVDVEQAEAFTAAVVGFLAA